MKSQSGSQHSAASASIYSEYYPHHDPEHSSPHSDKPDIDEELRRLKQEQEQFNQYTIYRSNSQNSFQRPQPLDLLAHQPSADEYAQPNADAQWGDPYASAPVSSPPMSAASFKSKGSARSRGSHRAPRKVSTPARFEPDREGRPLDSPMTTTNATSPRSASPFPFAPSMTSHDDRSLSIVPSIAPVQDDQRSSSIVPSIVPTQDDARSLSIVPSIAPTHDEHTSPVQDTQHLDPAILNYTPSNIDRNASIASTRTIPHSLFNDFDGVHVSPLVDEGIQEEDEEEEDHQQRNPPNDTPRQLNESAIRPTSEYELWFQEQWQQAEQLVPEEVRSEGTDKRHQSVHGIIEDAGEPSTPQPWAEPPPEEGMHYYPAPVPRDIKLPQRLSKQLPADVMAKRRSQVLGDLNPEARKSAVWLTGDREHSPEREDHTVHSPAREAAHKKKRSSANLKNLPPQLRASIFFDHEAVPQNIEMKDGSATATLEHLLDASVMGPPTTEMDPKHPDAVGKRRNRRSTTSLLDNDGRASRASMLSGPLSENKSDGRLSRASKLSGKRSVGSLDGLAQAGNRSSSALSLSRFSFEGKRNSSALEIEHPELRVVNGSDEGDQEVREEYEGMDERSVMHPMEGEYEEYEHGEVIRVDGEPVAEEEPEEEEEAEEEEDKDSDEFDEAIHGPPTTLLAELQLRKQKLRQRNRTAVSAFPNGMHSTLLELDAVAQVEKKRRKGKPTTLAWEDPSAKGAPTAVEDDDVPLGVLFPEHNSNTLMAKGRNEWDQPLGLLQQKEREENEPLSKRRNRLCGPQQAISAQQVQQQMPGLPQQVQEQHEDSEHEGETLAQRTRRLRSTRALDDAIGGGREGAQSRALSDEFATEMMMSTFGPLEGNKDKNAAKRESQINAVDAEPEQETLGQRRKRLQAEAAAARQVSGGSGGGSQPMSQYNPSMGNLLAQVPQSAFASRNVSGESGPSSGLIGENEAKRARERQQIANQNFRSGSGMGIREPLVGVGQDELQATNDGVNRGGAGLRQTFAPGQYSGLRSRSSMDLLQNAGQQSQQAPPQQQHNPWQGIAPQSFAQGLGAVGSGFQQHKTPTNQPFPHFQGNSGAALFANDPKGGIMHNPNRGSMLWQQEQSRLVSTLPRQWSDGNFGAMNSGGKTYAAHAQVKASAFEQMQNPQMSEIQRAKIEQWRTSIMQ